MQKNPSDSLDEFPKVEANDTLSLARFLKWLLGILSQRMLRLEATATSHETDADLAVRFGTLASPEVVTATNQTKPYVNTSLKVFRCELSGLNPGPNTISN